MKVNILDAHDRLKHFQKQEFDIGKMCQSIIDQRPFGQFPFYIYCHCRTIGLDEKISMFNQDMNDHFINQTPRKFKSLADVPEKRIIWQPRLTKPQASSNTMLFKAFPGSDLVRTIWILPARELWEQFEKDKLTENQIVVESIYNFRNNKEKLEEPESDDVSEETANSIYNDISFTARADKLYKRAYGL